jgi:hypothetical protein
MKEDEMERYNKRVEEIRDNEYPMLNGNWLANQ